MGLNISSESNHVGYVQAAFVGFPESVNICRTISDDHTFLCPTDSTNCTTFITLDNYVTYLIMGLTNKFL